MDNWYIVVVYEPDSRTVAKVLRFLNKHGEIRAVAILARIRDARVVGGLSQKNTKVVKGYLALPAP